MIREPRYGRLLDDFVPGEVHHHPWEVTLDDGLLAVFSSSFPDPNPLFSSARHARARGFRDRVVHPLVLLNLALGFSVHDISERTIANLGYSNVSFPRPAYPGDTLTATSEVVSVRRSRSRPDAGIVQVRTSALTAPGSEVVRFERQALIPAGMLTGSEVEAGDRPSGSTRSSTDRLPDLPLEIDLDSDLPVWPGRPGGLFDDFEIGERILHFAGRTIGDSEHMQLAALSRNTHPLHTDEVYCRAKSLRGTRLVCGGLVFAWIQSLASRDVFASALWHVQYDEGRHLNPVVAGDTLYAASRVVSKVDLNERAGVLMFEHRGFKNTTPRALLDSGVDLFATHPEEQIFEVTSTLILPRRW